MITRKFLFSTLIAILVAATISIAGCSSSTPVEPGDSQPGITADNADHNASQPYLVGFTSTPDQADESLVRTAGGTVSKSFTLIPVLAVTLPQNAVDSIRNNPGVEFIELDAEVHATEETIPWGVSRINADDVWPLGYDGAGVIVAVLDTGIDYNHPDLAPNYIDGYDFAYDDNDPWDGAGHGTHVSGTIAASALNNAGVTGVSPSIGILAGKVLDDGGNGYLSDVIAGIEWAVANSADVINMSLGTDSRSKAFQYACDSAYAAGLVLVAAAGNDGFADGRGNNVDYPAKYASVIAVASTDQNDQRVWYSSTGREVELAAPGWQILSCIPGGGLGLSSGTSMASPHVAGTVALLIHSGVTNTADIRSAMTSTALDLGPAGKDNMYGYGLVDALAALSGDPPPPPPPPPPDGEGSIAGKVTDAATGKGIGGAMLSLDSGGTVYTNPSGRYKFSNVPTGDYDVTADASGYISQTHSVSVYEAQTSTLNFAMISN